MLEWCVIVAVGVAAVYLTVDAARRWRGDRYLCDNCRFNDPQACLKPERPQAVDCAAYRPVEEQRG